MQFILEGPDIPEALLNAHAEGRVVFFCGAGVSLDAGYPLFGGLVENLKSKNPITYTPELDEAINASEFDFALSIIQKRLANNSIKLRRDTAEILSGKPLSLKNHRAILRLSRARDGACRLITTNFDRLFIKASKGARSINVDSAPKLPIPKIERWNSVLHLHGLLPDSSNDIELGNLILTSADFGEAYVTDSYCSRFVVELLRNFVVVFIGYSLNDRIMRYLLDAISFSEKFFDGSQKNGHFNKPYAFVEHNEQDKEKVIKRWDLKEVIPIPYFVEEQRRRNRGSHYRLYDTLNAWADLASGGQRARVTLALNEAQKPFLSEDTFTQERFLWALKDSDGKVADALASVETKDQTASIGWLPFFAEHGLLDQVYSPQELHQFRQKQQRNRERNQKPEYLGSLTNGNRAPRLKPVSLNLARWMQWHLDSTELLDWMLEKGSVPHPEFCWIYNHPSNESKKLALKQDQKRIWDIVTSDAYSRSRLPSSYWFDLRENLNFSDKLDVTEFVEHIRPFLSVRPSFYRDMEGHDEGPFSEYEFELKLANAQMGYQVGEIISNPERQIGLEELCEDLTKIVSSGLDWLALVGKASPRSDFSGFGIPSISSHAQNAHVDDFWALTLLLRASFDRLQKTDASRAAIAATRWLSVDYPLFKRLFLYAANQIGEELDKPALDLLTEQQGSWLWALDAKKEVNTYLRERVKNWKKEQIAKLCDIVLKGPQRNNFREMSDADWQRTRNRNVMHFLLKLQQGGVALPKEVKFTLAALPQEYRRDLPDDHSDEFIIYSGPVRDVPWDEDAASDPEAFRNFSKKSPLERAEQWIPTEATFFRKLAMEQPEAVLQTLEEGLARIEDVGFWSEGISSLARAIDEAKEVSKELQSDGR